jgi:hypothetical protein
VPEKADAESHEKSDDIGGEWMRAERYQQADDEEVDEGCRCAYEAEGNDRPSPEPRRRNPSGSARSHRRIAEAVLTAAPGAGP